MGDAVRARPADNAPLMHAIFFRTLISTGESGTGAEAHPVTARDDSFGYSGPASFDGGFDQFGFVPIRSYEVVLEPDADAHERSDAR